MTTRPTHVCVYLKSYSYPRNGVLVNDSACATCGQIRGEAVPVVPAQPRLLAERKETK